ncbi:MAG TPA: helix-turn-helix transcriptional regulator [Polyangiaceae bacterium]|nr:helix-turn-helix transcriptional regulator [Polyangiaceae bacterium]
MGRPAAPGVSTVRPAAREEDPGRDGRMDPRAEKTTCGELHAMLRAVLDAIPAAALLVSREGTLLESNTAGRQWLDRDGAREPELRAAARGQPPGDLAVTEIAGGGGVILLVQRQADADGDPDALTVPSRWRFTARERDILELLVDGRSNRTIAAALEIVERTVETHLTSMFEKAGVESRAELVARVRRG